MSNSRMPCVAAVPLERREHVLGHHVEERPPLIARRDDVIDGREWCDPEIAPASPRARSMSNACGRRDLVDEMQADEQLRLPVRQLADRVRVPDLLQERRWHGQSRSYYTSFAIRGSRVAVRGQIADGLSIGLVNQAGHRESASLRPDMTQKLQFF